MADRFEHRHHRLARLADAYKRKAEEHRQEQHLQQIALGKGADERLRNDADQKGCDRLVFGGGDICADLVTGQRRRIDVEARARLDDVGDDQADDQGKRREGEEVAERLGDDAPQLADVAHPGDAGDDGQENNRRDDHLDQPDEGIAQRLHGHAGVGIEMADQSANEDRCKNLRIKLGIQRLARGRGEFS